ncbi:hypothetical protein IHE44_0001599 [Lamprotornis superbus]|uniref:Uncharacterized protein n=1 Tax=Lamprotornis superbus TaxID=245042 RepID=A0A835NTQ5_9PASS|nr:hypothetical protein IHE44_0001599 [Lamprotornis superbus]
MGEWRSLTPVGQPIPGTRFIAFKVPLKGAINQRLTPTQKFTPKDLIAAMKALNVELGLIIDLTYTTRYYEVKDLPKSVQYKKLYTVGLEVPDNATILQFKKYLIDVEGWDPEAAIQAFGDARGHRMDGLVYLTDLRTQPMRSNLGMDVWDADEDIIPPPHAMEGSVERFPNEDFQGSGKRLRIYDDHSYNDLQGQMQLRDFDFINKGPGQRRRPFHDHQTQDELRASVQMRNWDYNRGPEQRQRAFSDHQFYDDYQEDTQLKDLDFSNKGRGQSLRPFHGHQFHDDLQADRQSFDFNRGREQRQRSFPDHPSPNDLQEDRQSKDFDFGGRGRGQRRKLFHDHQSHDEFQTQMQLKELDSASRGPGQRLRAFHDYESHDDSQTQRQLGDFEFVKRGRGQRLRPFNDHEPHNDLKTEMQLKDYDNKGPGQRCRPFHDPQPYDGLQEQTQSKDFDYGNKGHGKRPRPFHDHPGHNDLPREWCSDRDYGSDNDDFNRNYRLPMFQNSPLQTGELKSWCTGKLSEEEPWQKTGSAAALTSPCQFLQDPLRVQMQTTRLTLYSLQLSADCALLVPVHSNYQSCSSLSSFHGEPEKQLTKGTRLRTSANFVYQSGTINLNDSSGS